MDRNVRIARELVKLAKSILATWMPTESELDEIAEKLQNGKASLENYVYLYDILIDKYPAIRSMFANKIKLGYGSTMLSEHISWIDKYPDIRSAFVEGLKGRHYGFSVLRHHLGLIDKYPKIRDAFADRVKTLDSDIYCIVYSKSFAELLNKHPEIRSAFVEGVRNGGECCSVLVLNPGYIDKYPELRDAFIEALNKGRGLYELKKHPDFVQIHPEFRKYI